VSELVKDTLLTRFRPDTSVALQLTSIRFLNTLILRFIDLYKGPSLFLYI
jgi:hypothetical protein